VNTPGDIPALLAKYEGREGKLLSKVKKKYNIDQPLRQKFALDIPR
jgi:hypothetical protein